MAGKKSQNGSRSDSEGTTEARRAPMREFSRSLPMSLLRAREAVMRQFRPSLRNHGLTEQQWRILRALTAVDTIEVTELARVAFLLVEVAGQTWLAPIRPGEDVRVRTFVTWIGTVADHLHGTEHVLAGLLPQA